MSRVWWLGIAQHAVSIATVGVVQDLCVAVAKGLVWLLSASSQCLVVPWRVLVSRRSRLVSTGVSRDMPRSKDVKKALKQALDTDDGDRVKELKKHRGSRSKDSVDVREARDFRDGRVWELEQLEVDDPRRHSLQALLVSAGHHLDTVSQHAHSSRLVPTGAEDMEDPFYSGAVEDPEFCELYGHLSQHDWYGMTLDRLASRWVGRPRPWKVSEWDTLREWLSNARYASTTWYRGHPHWYVCFDEAKKFPSMPPPGYDRSGLSATASSHLEPVAELVPRSEQARPSRSPGRAAPTPNSDTSSDGGNGQVDDTGTISIEEVAGRWAYDDPVPSDAPANRVFNIRAPFGAELKSSHEGRIGILSDQFPVLARGRVISVQRKKDEPAVEGRLRSDGRLYWSNGLIWKPKPALNKIPLPHSDQESSAAAVPPCGAQTMAVIGDCSGIWMAEDESGPQRHATAGSLLNGSRLLSACSHSTSGGIATLKM